MSSLVIALAVAILVYVLFVIVVPKTVPNESDDYLHDALNRLEEENREAERAREIVLRDQLNEAPFFVRMVFDNPLMRPIYQAGLEAGYQGHFEQLLVMMLFAFGVGLGGGMLLGLGLWSLPIGLALAYLYPMRHCRRKLIKRNRKFIDQFPDALDMIVRSVRSGFPLSVALQMLAENAEDPVKSEFRQVTDEIALGRNLSDALNRLSTRINEPDIRFFVVVLTVQQETGGNLAEIIGNLSYIIRKRKQLRHKIRAMTSEGKATGWVLGSLPVLVFGSLFIAQPDYLDPFFNDPLGIQLLVAAVVLLVSCFFIVKQMINIDI